MPRGVGYGIPQLAQSYQTPIAPVALANTRDPIETPLEGIGELATLFALDRRQRRLSEADLDRQRQFGELAASLAFPEMADPGAGGLARGEFGAQNQGRGQLAGLLAGNPELAQSFAANMLQRQYFPDPAQAPKTRERKVSDQIVTEEFVGGKWRELSRAPRATRSLEDEMALRAAGRSVTNLNVNTGPSTPGLKKVDEDFAKEYNQLVSGGGFADIDKGLAQLDEVARQLDAIATGESDADLTGKMIGLQPKGLRNLTNPASVNAQELVEEVVQRNLRLILGAQFTEKEGIRLIERAYNPNLDEAENAVRVRRLLDAVKRARDAKFAAAKYFETNKTLEGFPGTAQFTLDDIARDAGLEEPEESDEELRRRVREILGTE